MNFRKIFLLSCSAAMVACTISPNEKTEPISTATDDEFGWYYKLSPVDFIATLDSNEVTIWHERQGTARYSTEIECMSAAEESLLSLKNVWNYEIECRAQNHPSRKPLNKMDFEVPYIDEGR